MCPPVKERTVPGEHRNPAGCNDSDAGHIRRISSLQVY